MNTIKNKRICLIEEIYCEEGCKRVCASNCYLDCACVCPIHPPSVLDLAILKTFADDAINMRKEYQKIEK